MSLEVGLTVLKIIRSQIIPKIQKGVQKAFSDKYLLFTNVGLSFTLSGLGDVIEQQYEIMTDKINEWDKVRTRHMATSGITVGIVCHNWYRYLDKMLPGYTIKIVTRKILLDQFIGSPLYIFTFFATIAYLEESSKDEFIQELKNKYFKLYAAEWMIWPPAQFINFYFLSTKYRVLFDSSVSLVYDIFTSHIKYQDSHDKNSKR